MSFKPPQYPDPWTDRLAGLAAIRGFVGESTIKETSTIDLTTRVTMPLLQAVSIGLGFVGFCLSGWGMVDGLIASFGMELQPGLYLMSLLLVAMLGVGTWAILRNFFTEHQRALAYSIAAFLVLFVVVAVMSAVLEIRSNFDWLRFGEILLGGGGMVGSVLLVYHQILNITDPYWRTSPAERELLALWRQGPQPQTKTAARIPYRHSGRVERILPKEPADEERPDPFEYEVLDFLSKSREIGLSLRAWARDTTTYLESTGAKVTETKWATIIDRLAEDGYVEKGGDGYPTDWADGWDAESAYEEECQRFESAWGNVLFA